MDMPIWNREINGLFHNVGLPKIPLKNMTNFYKNTRK
jgi:hypothetical protein